MGSIRTYWFNGLILLILLLFATPCHAGTPMHWQGDSFTYIPHSYSELYNYNGRTQYCKDCQITNPCSAGGTGTWAFNINGTWNCNGLIPPTTPVTSGMYNFNNIVNVMAAPFNAKGDGVTDDTAALQAAINATPAGGTVIFPARPCGSPYVITAPIHPLVGTNGQTAHLLGQGWNSIVNDVFGGTGPSSWPTLNNHCGSVIYQKTAGQDGIDLGVAATQAAPYFVRDLMILGPGSGVSSGIAMGKPGSFGTPASHLENILIADFAVGLQLNNTEDSGFYDLRTRGCSNGIVASTLPSNQNNFYNLECNTDTQCVNWQSSGDTNNFFGGLVQNATLAGFIFGAGIQNSSIIGFHFENTSMTNDGIQINGSSANGTSNVITGNRFADAASSTDIHLTGSQAIFNTVSSNFASKGITEDGGAGKNIFINNRGGTFALAGTSIHLNNSGDQTTFTPFFSMSSTPVANCPGITGGGGACNKEGALCAVTDNSTACAFGSTIASGGTHHGLAYCDGANYVQLSCR